MEVNKGQRSGSAMHAGEAQGEALQIAGAEDDTWGGAEDAATQGGDGEDNLGDAEDDGTDIRMTQQDTSGKLINIFRLHGCF